MLHNATLKLKEFNQILKIIFCLFLIDNNFTLPGFVFNYSSIKSKNSKATNGKLGIRIKCKLISNTRIKAISFLRI